MAGRRTGRGLWIVCGIGLAALLCAETVTGMAVGAARCAAQEQRAWLDAHAVVADGAWVGNEVSPAIPQVRGWYAVTLPADADPPFGGRSSMVASDWRWGLDKDSVPFPAHWSFLVAPEQHGVRVLAAGRPGAVDPVTEQSIAAADDQLARKKVVRVLAQDAGAFVVTVPAAAAVVRWQRRRRALRRGVGATVEGPGPSRPGPSRADVSAAGAAEWRP